MCRLQVVDCEKVWLVVSRWLFTPRGCGWWLEQENPCLSPSSRGSGSPSSLDRRTPSAGAEPWGEGSPLGAEAGEGAGAWGLEVEALELGALERDTHTHTQVSDRETKRGGTKRGLESTPQPLITS